MTVGPSVMTDQEWWESHPGDVTTVDTAEAHDETVAFLLDALAEVPAGNVLDLGCGVGRLALPVAAARPDLVVVGVDTSLEAISRAQIARRGDALIANPVPNMSFSLGDGRRIPWPCESFAAVWSVCLFQHIDPATAAGYVAEVGRVLAPGGLFVCQFVPPVGQPTHQPRLHEHTLAEMVGWCVDGGLMVESLVAGPLHPLWCWLTARKLA